MARTRSYGMRVGLQSGVLPYRYSLTPYVWITNPTPSHWQLPSSVGGIDLRPLGAQAQAGGAPQGRGFCASRSAVAGDELVAAYHPSDALSTSPMRDAWLSAMGYRPAGTTLLDLLWDQLTVGADPSGDAGPKPLMPGADGQLRLYLGGHSLVRQERFEFGKHPHTNQVRVVLQRDFREMWEASGGDDHCCRVLDFWCEKHGVSDWREFVPAGLRAHVPGRLPHETTLTDDFNRADSTNLGADWTETAGDASIASNQLAASSFPAEIRHTSNLSSADHYSQCALVVLPATNDGAGPLARFSAAASDTFYVSDFQDNVGAPTSRCTTYKRITGTYTLIAGPTGVTFSLPDTAKIECNGSTIKAYFNGAEVHSVTDSGISGNLRTGLRIGATSTARLDDFEAADLAAAGDAVPVCWAQYRARMVH
jgi:hypothetical protein